MKPWLREDTQAFLAEQIVLAKTVKDYTDKTYEYCRENMINDHEIIIAITVMSAAWVYQNLDHKLTVGICPDILDIPYEEQDHNINPDRPILINNQLSKLRHDKLLKKVTEAFT